MQFFEEANRVMLDLELIAQFLTVAQYMNFTKAAEAMYLSHTTVSRNMARLEAALGITLFERDNRRITLTAAGQLLVQKGERLLLQASMLEQELLIAERQGSGQITIASFNFYLSEIYHCFHLFQKVWHNYELVMHYKNMDEILPMVASGNADLGISFSFAMDAAKSEYEIIPFAKGRFYALVSIDHPLAQRTSIYLADLEREQMIILGQMDYDFVMNIGKGRHRTGPYPKVAASIESLFLQVKAGVGMALLPQHAISETLGGCVALELADMESEYEAVIVYDKKNRNSALRKMLDILQGNLGPL